jgi:predicted DNA-binding antitoxin AbrB/MazE fold protein
MTTPVKAIYENGVLKPESPLELEEHTEVEVLVTPVARATVKVQGKLSDYLRTLPPGTRSKEDIDQQIREERDSWS